MLFKQAAKITFVMYQDQKSARAFQLDKTKLKWMALLISMLFTTSLLTTLFLLAQRKKGGNTTQESAQILALKGQLLEQKTLQDDLTQAQKLNEQLLKKAPMAQVQREAVLPLVNLPVGYQNLGDKSWTKIENIDISFSAKQALLHFDLINTKQDGTRLSGHILALMSHGPQISFYPPTHSSLNQTMVTYNRGETFTISRFRKVEAFFKASPEESSQVYFKILIFSRAGDIIHQKTIGPIKVTQS